MSEPISIPSMNSRPEDDALKQSMFKSILCLFGILALCGLTSANPLVTSVGMLLPPLLFQLLWRIGEPPVLLFAAMFQWLQVMATVLACDVESITLFEKYGGEELEMAIWLSLLAVTVLAVGMKSAISTMRAIPPQIITTQLNLLSVNRLFVGYIICSIISMGLIFAGGRIASLRQPLFALAGIRWVPISLLMLHGLQPRNNPNTMIGIVLIEVANGLTGFFSSFKEVLFLLIVMMSGGSSSRRRIPTGGIIMVSSFLLILSCFWQVIKPGYREFLQAGTKSQSVNVPINERLNYLLRSCQMVTLDSLFNGFTSGIERLGYVTFFAHSIRNVPKNVPHQDGALWGGALKHVVTPRIFFPNKPSISDSARTRQFTGIRVAGDEQATSISIGFIGESYIDFGMYGMFVPIYLLGYTYGAIYRLFSRMRGYEVLGLATAVSLQTSSLLRIDDSNIKLFGGMIAGVIAMYVVLRFWKKTIWLFICDGASAHRSKVVEGF